MNQSGEWLNTIKMLQENVSTLRASCEALRGEHNYLNTLEQMQIEANAAVERVRALVLMARAAQSASAR